MADTTKRKSTTTSSEKTTRTKKATSTRSVKYEGKEKIYYTKSKKKCVLKLSVRIVGYLILFVFFFTIGYSCLSFSRNIDNKNTEKINYSEKGNSKFKVYLKDNSYYDSKYLDSGMNYVTSLINMINVNYNYEIHADEKINYDYKYDVNAKVIISEKDKEDKILYVKDYELLKEKTLKGKDTNFVINENVDIDFNKYNDYVNQYKKDYSLDTSAKLVVTMNIKANGNAENSKDSISKDNKFEMTIPLSQQTIDINKSNDAISTSGFLVVNKKSSFESILLLIVSIVLYILSISCIARIVYLVIKKNQNKTLYEITIAKYKKEYDRAIVETSMPDIDETKFKDVIRVTSMNELLDLHDNFKYPIFHYEVEPGSKSYFVIIKDDILYKLTISAAFLNKSGDK